ncbi:MAG: hypothetical protein WC789_04265 [Lentisphaeria bacterium]
MKKVIALFSLCAATLTAFANGPLPGEACLPGSELAVILKGSFKDSVNFENDGASCVEWAKLRGKYDIYLALCYTEIDCTTCDNTGAIDPIRSILYVVSKSDKEILSAPLASLPDYELLCLGGNDIALSFYMGKVGGWVVLTGKRDCKYGIKSLAGAGINMWEDGCFGSVFITTGSLRRDDSLTKKLYGSPAGNPYCPQCTEQSTPCDSLQATLEGFLEKKYKDYAWFTATD